MVGAVAGLAVSCCVDEVIYGACVHVSAMDGGTHTDAHCPRQSYVTHGATVQAPSLDRVLWRIHSPLLTPRPNLDLDGLCMAVQIRHLKLDILQPTPVLAVDIFKYTNAPLPTPGIDGPSASRVVRQSDTTRLH